MPSHATRNHRTTTPPDQTTLHFFKARNRVARNRCCPGRLRASFEHADLPPASSLMLLLSLSVATFLSRAQEVRGGRWKAHCNGSKRWYAIDQAGLRGVFRLHFGHAPFHNSAGSRTLASVFVRGSSRCTRWVLRSNAALRHLSAFLACSRCVSGPRRFPVYSTHERNQQSDVDTWLVSTRASRTVEVPAPCRVGDGAQPHVEAEVAWPGTVSGEQGSRCFNVRLMLGFPSGCCICLVVGGGEWLLPECKKQKNRLHGWSE